MNNHQGQNKSYPYGEIISLGFGNNYDSYVKGFGGNVGQYSWADRQFRREIKTIEKSQTKMLEA